MEELNAENIKKLYELSFVQESETNDAAKTAITTNGGEIKDERPLVKIRLAYPINKQTQGFFGLIRFYSYPSGIASVDKELRMNGEFIRYSVSKFAANENTGGRERRTFDRDMRRVRFNRTEKRSIEHEALALSNEELEKKIEEILQ